MCGGVTPCLNGAQAPAASNSSSGGQPTPVPNLGRTDLGTLYGFSALVVIPVYAAVFALSLLVLLYSWWCTPARQHAFAVKLGFAAPIAESASTEDVFPAKAAGGGVGLSAEAAANLGWRDYADDGAAAARAYAPPTVAAAVSTTVGVSSSLNASGGSGEPGSGGGAGPDAPMRSAHRWGALRQ
jgi:hypothetical protein